MPPPDLEAIYDAHAQAIFAFALSLTRSEVEAKDALQEIFCKLAQLPTLLANARNERAVLLRMTYYWVVDESRRRKSRDQRSAALAPTSVFEASINPDENLFREELENALAELPTDQRAVVHLKLWGGLTFDAIADALQIPANTAASRYRYGLDKLRARLRPLYEEIQ